jgi:hypothetical protein
VRLTTQAGGAAVRRSVFDRIPGEGLWDAVLLADGNVGTSVRHQIVLVEGRGDTAQVMRCSTRQIPSRTD